MVENWEVRLAKRLKQQKRFQRKKHKDWISNLVGIKFPTKGTEQLIGPKVPTKGSQFTIIENNPFGKLVVKTVRKNLNTKRFSMRLRGRGTRKVPGGEQSHVPLETAERWAVYVEDRYANRALKSCQAKNRNLNRKVKAISKITKEGEMPFRILRFSGQATEEGESFIHRIFGR